MAVGTRVVVNLGAASDDDVKPNNFKRVVTPAGEFWILKEVKKTGGSGIRLVRSQNFSVFCADARDATASISPCSIIRCCQDHPIGLGIFSKHGRRIIGVGIASQRRGDVNEVASSYTPIAGTTLAIAAPEQLGHDESIASGVALWVGWKPFKKGSL